MERARGDLSSGRVRFLIVSTHHHSISGDSLTHQRALARVRDAGAHVVAEHSVSESFSGDGLIAVSFDAQDRDLVVNVSRARARDSLFGEPEIDVDTERRRADEAHRRALALERRLETLEQELETQKRWLEHRAAREQLVAMEQTKLWRWSRPARRLYERLRGRPGVRNDAGSARPGAKA